MFIFQKQYEHYIWFQIIGALLVESVLVAV